MQNRKFIVAEFMDIATWFMCRNTKILTDISLAEKAAK